MRGAVKQLHRQVRAASCAVRLDRHLWGEKVSGKSASRDQGSGTKSQDDVRSLIYSAEAAGGFDDHGEDAGFVAGDEEGDMAVDGDFSLQQLLAGGVDICGVGERQVAAQLLFDNDAGGGVAEGAEVVGIDFTEPAPKSF